MTYIVSYNSYIVYNHDSHGLLLHIMHDLILLLIYFINCSQSQTGNPTKRPDGTSVTRACGLGPSFDSWRNGLKKAIFGKQSQFS